MTQNGTLRMYDPDQPNALLLQRDGWKVGATVGSYCMAWRHGEEVVLVWQNGEWIPILSAYRIAS